MGTPKPLLEWGGHTLIEYQLAQLKKPPIDRVAVVLGHRAEEVQPYVRRAGAQVIVNELYGEGRACSLRVAAAALPNDSAAVLATYEERRGHPPVLAGSLLPELREVSEATQGLRAVIRRHAKDVKEVAFETEVVLLDLNRPQEYEKARATYFAA
jgi:CTP:molybdopterin cytidylyltransferase MocA